MRTQAPWRKKHFLILYHISNTVHGTLYKVSAQTVYYFKYWMEFRTFYHKQTKGFYLDKQLWNEGLLGTIINDSYKDDLTT